MAHLLTIEIKVMEQLDQMEVLRLDQMVVVMVSMDKELLALDREADSQLFQYQMVLEQMGVIMDHKGDKVNSTTQTTHHQTETTATPTNLQTHKIPLEMVSLSHKTTDNRIQLAQTDQDLKDLIKVCHLEHTKVLALL